jgi:hypothetical protein
MPFHVPSLFHGAATSKAAHPLVFSPLEWHGCEIRTSNDERTCFYSGDKQHFVQPLQWLHPVKAFYPDGTSKDGPPETIASHPVVHRHLSSNKVNF